MGGNGIKKSFPLISTVDPHNVVDALTPYEFVPNKPKQFGIRFGVLAELTSKYSVIVKVKPHLNKDE